MWQLAEKAPELPTVPLFGGFMLVFAFFCSSTIVQYAAVEEKRNELLGIMRRIGLHESVHVSSWLFASALPSFLTALLATATGDLCKLTIFERSNFFIMLILFFLADVAFCSASLWLGSMFTRQWVNYAVTFVTLGAATSTHFIFVLISFGTGQATCCAFPDGVPPNPECTGATGTYPQDIYLFASFFDAAWLNGNSFVRFLLFMCPFFHFGRAFNAIQQVTYDKTATGGQLGLPLCTNRGDCHFGWAQLAETVNQRDLALRAGCTISPSASFSPELNAPSVGFSFGCLVANIIVYSILTWYCGQVLSSGQGSTLPLYFPLDPRYWGFIAQVQRVYIEGDTVEREKRLSASERSIRCWKLSKAFAKNTALKELSVSLLYGEMTALLGENGAGKTTLVNVLTGLFNRTDGNAFLLGHDLDTERAQIQQLVGICAQENLLYPELTGAEHIELYAKFKGLAAGPGGAKRLEDEVKARLDSVKLLPYKDRRAIQYSGGMKRRLSVAIACIGSPSLLYLDGGSIEIREHAQTVSHHAYHAYNR
jgi:ABC-type lipoprotein export system ATPase subunit